MMELPSDLLLSLSSLSGEFSSSFPDIQIRHRSLTESTQGKQTIRQTNKRKDECFSNINIHLARYNNRLTVLSGKVYFVISFSSLSKTCLTRTEMHIRTPQNSAYCSTQRLQNTLHCSVQH